MAGRPQMSHCPQQGRLATAGTTAEHHTLALLHGHVGVGQQVTTVRQVEAEVVHLQDGARILHVDRWRTLFVVTHGLVEAQQTIAGGAPGSEALVGTDEPAEAFLHIAERRADLHQFAQFDLAGKVTRGGNHEGEDDRGLAVTSGEERQALGHLHDVPEVMPDHPEAAAQPAVFVRLSVVQRDAFGVLANSHHGETQVSFEALLLIVQADQATTDQMRQPAADHRVNQHAPEHVAGNGDAEYFNTARHAPQDDRERHQADDIAQQPDTQLKGVGGEVVEVFGNPLVRVIGVTALLQLVVVFVRQPTAEMLFGEPRPPADRQHLRQVEPIHRADDRHRRNRTEIQDQLPERCLVLLLQGVVEVLVPGVEPHRDPHADQRQRNHRDQQCPGLDLLFTAPVRRDHRPHFAKKLPAHSVVDRGILSVLIHG
ncbi:hypothetical protein D3C80_997560 [compost metagenome]